jgi:Ca2+-binding EF-hand superfamily protein
MNGIVKSTVAAMFAMTLSAVSVATMAADKSSKSESWPSFKKVDTDKSGAISQDEARAVPGLVDNFTQYDKNGDGQLSKSEYEAANKAAKAAHKSGGGMSGSSSSGASSATSPSSSPAPSESAGSSTGSGAQQR